MQPGPEGMRLLSLGTVLVATDLEPSSDAAVSSACALARIAGAALTVLNAAPIAGGEGGEGAMEAALGRAGVRRSDVTVEYAVGTPVPAIQAAADRVSADVIVLGPHRHPDGGGERRTLGSTAYGVVSGARVPCLVLAEPLPLPLERVLVPIDLSDTARGALMVALTWSSALRSRGTTELTVLHVDESASPPGGGEGEARIEAELALLRRTGGTWAGVSVRSATAVSDDVADAIAERAAGQDLVVLGTRGLSAVGSGLGSVAAALLQRVRTPLLLVPPAVWQAYGPGAG